MPLIEESFQKALGPWQLQPAARDVQAHPQASTTSVAGVCKKKPLVGTANAQGIWGTHQQELLLKERTGDEQAFSLLTFVVGIIF